LGATNGLNFFFRSRKASQLPPAAT
jgi:hypothetical protein